MEWGKTGGVALAAAILACAGTAQAERFDLFVFENSSGADVSGLDLWVDVRDQGSFADFVFHNDSSIGSSIARVYIENTSASGALLSDGTIFAESSGVDFTPGSAPPNPPGSISGFGGAWGGNLFSAGAVSPPPFRGINPGETLTLRFDLTGSFSDLLDALTNGEFRIAQHVIALPEGASVWTVLVPLPPAAWPGITALASLGVVGYVRRRRMAEA